MLAGAGVLVVVLAAARGDAPTLGPDDGDARLRVLFLGDRGHHEPESRADAIAPAFARLGIDVWFRPDLAVLDPERLSHVDVVLIYANHDEIAPEHERALLDFVEGGKGLVAVHCASYCFRNSEKYVALVGGQFERHGVAEFTARTLAPDHPALRGVAEFATTDETYVHRALSADRTVLQVREEAGVVEPCTWVREQGPGPKNGPKNGPKKGRVYYTALGHDERTWGQAAFQAQLAQAIRWAADRPEFTWTPPKLEFVEAKLPNYTPGAQWGTEGAAISKMQKPLSPSDERRTMQLPPGFDARLFASEPDVVKPIAMSFDARGRLWVLESVDYPNDKQPRRAGDDGLAIAAGRDRVKILEDTDGDARVDVVKVFADGLNIPTGIVCTSDGCIVAQAPDMLRFFDRDGDDRADERRVLFTGFGEGDTHAGPSNLRRGGPRTFVPFFAGDDEVQVDDHWIYGTVGYSAFHGKVGGVEHQFGQAVFRFGEGGTVLERLASTTNNTWGLGLDEQGEIFVSTANGDHLVHVAVPSTAIESVFGLVADGTVHVPDHDRLHPLIDMRQVDYHGGFTAAAGCAIYTGRQFPHEYWNRCAFVCEPTGHLVHQCFLEPQGSTFVARDGRNLLASWDEWCAPIAAEVGPDGAVWVLDWYSPIVQHNPTPHGFTTGKGNAYETPHRDKEHGRIWKVVYEGGDGGGAHVDEKGSSLAPSDAGRRRVELLTTMDRASAAAASAALSTWEAARAGEDRPLALAAEIALAREWPTSLPLALARGPGGGAADLRSERPILLNADFAHQGREMPANWRPVVYGGIAVHSWNESGHEAAGSSQLSSSSGADASLSQSVKVEPHARCRLSGWIKTDGITPLGDGYGALFNVHELQSPRVVTPAVTGTHEWTRVEVEFDSGDHEQLTINCLLGGWGRARGTAWYDDVVLELVTKGSPAAELVNTVATHAAHEDPARALSIAASQLGECEPVLARAALEGLARGWPRENAPKIELDAATAQELQRVASRLDVSGRAALLLVAERIGRLDLFPDEVSRVQDELHARLVDDTVPAAERVDAARRLLALASAGDAVPLVAAQLFAIAPPELVKGLLLALGEAGADEVGTEVARRAPQLSLTTLPTAVELLLRRPAWTKELLAQLVARKLDPKSLAPDVLDCLQRSDDAEIVELATKVAASIGRARNADREKIVDARMHLVAPTAKPGDAKRGAEVFQAQCAKCHTIRGQGGPVGPDLTGIGKRGKAELLIEILDPNRSVEGNWRVWDVTLKNGDNFSGRLVNEGRATIELVDAAAARHVIARGDIERLRPLARSLMPEGLEDLGDADLAALLEFLVTDAR